MEDLTCYCIEYGSAVPCDFARRQRNNVANYVVPKEWRHYFFMQRIKTTQITIFMVARKGFGNMDGHNVAIPVSVRHDVYLENMALNKYSQYEFRSQIRCFLSWIH